MISIDVLSFRALISCYVGTSFSVLHRRFLSSYWISAILLFVSAIEGSPPLAFR